MALELQYYGIPIFYFFVALSLILPRIPVVGKFFSTINTGIHEFGHAVMTLILDGKVVRIELNKDTSGITESSNIKSKFAAFLVAISGYLTASTAAFIAAYLVNSNLSRALLIALSIIFFVMLIFWIRNIYGILWGLPFCFFNGYLIYTESSITIYFSLFYATTMLIESLFSTIEQLFIVIKNPNQLCDATNLKKITGIPSFIWALLFIVFAVSCCYFSLF